MSNEETVLKVKIATVASIGMAILSLAVTALGGWTLSLWSKVGQHGEAIATMQECNRNMMATMVRVEGVVEAIRQDQIDRRKGH